MFRAEFGLGYAWKPSVAEIKAGDYIKFVWTSPMFLTTNNFAVMEVFSPEAEYNGTGFISEDASPSGKCYTMKDLESYPRLGNQKHKKGHESCDGVALYYKIM